jgi:hypothetical protein
LPSIIAALTPPVCARVLGPWTPSDAAFRRAGRADDRLFRAEATAATSEGEFGLLFQPYSLEAWADALSVDGGIQNVR